MEYSTVMSNHPLITNEREMIREIFTLFLLRPYAYLRVRLTGWLHFYL